MPPADERDLAKLIGELAPQLLRQPRISNVLAAEIYNAWSHPDAFVPRRHFATLPGVAPIPASSGQVVRHRLNRSGDRRLNRALRPWSPPVTPRWMSLFRAIGQVKWTRLSLTKETRSRVGLR